MSDRSDQYISNSTRRSFIKAGVAGGATFLAGCSGDGDNNANPGGNGNGGNTDGPRFQIFDPLTSGASPDQRHYNPWNPRKSGAWHPGANTFDRPAIYSPTKNEAYGNIVDSWEKTGEEVLEATFSDEWTWHNGDQFVAQDWVTQMEMDAAIQQASGQDPLIDQIELVDDFHVRITMDSPLSEIFAVQNTIGIYNGLLARGVFTKHDDDQWSSWHEQLVNASGDELTRVANEVTSTDYPKITSEDAIGHGPYMVTETSDTEIIMEKYEDHPNVSDDLVDTMTLKLFSSGRPFSAYSNGEVDAAHNGFPVKEDLRSRLPDGHQVFREGRSSNKLFAFNCGHGEANETPVADHRVRKAIMHIFDKDGITKALQGVNRLFEWAPCRVPGKVLAEGTVDVSDFVEYGQNDTERAAELLRRADYEQDNLGNWLKPDGKRFQINIMNGVTRPDVQMLKKNLREFGIKVRQEQVDSATFNERRKNGEYHIMPDGSSANGITAMWAPGLVVDWISSITHYDPEVEIPMPIGDPEGNSGTKTINIPDHITKWMTTGEDQYHRELMWWWNQYLPEAENMYQPDAGAYNSGDWEVEVRDGILNGVDDALYIAAKMEDGTISHKG